VPAFFTGSLIKRFGERPMLLAGIMLIGFSAWINIGGTELLSYTLGLTVLGVGWNFLFVSCTTLIADTYRTEGEKARVQSANDFLIYGTVILSTFSAGPLEESIGWFALNEAALVVTAVVGAVLVLLMWKERRSAAVAPKSAGR